MTATTTRTRLANFNNSRDYADLPHQHRCGARWSGTLTAHCGSCCRTFTGIGSFDHHRRGGVCANPAGIGMVLADGRAYQAWTTTREDGTDDDT